MREDRDKLNPYSVLEVDRDASVKEIEVAYRLKMNAAAVSATASVVHLEAAYRILKDPERREHLNRKLDAQTMMRSLSEAIPEDVSSTKPDLRGIKVALLIGLLVVCLFFALREGGAVCPQCHHATLIRSENPDGRLTFSCRREACNFTYVYDANEDTDEYMETGTKPDH